MDVVDCFDESKGRYLCPLCHSELRELESDSVEESAETMQNKIKTQVNSFLKDFHSDLIGTLEQLKGQQIYSIHPRESIEKELKEKCLSVMILILFDIGSSIHFTHWWWRWWRWRWWPFAFFRYSCSYYRDCG